MSRARVLAAGGVLWRGAPEAPEVALVHRPAYDDWSLPKGKRSAGEHLLVTALREVEEETGHRPLLGPRLATVRYRVTSGGRRVTKSVTYWSMRSAGGRFAASREVDDLVWATLRDARRQLTSAADRDVLEIFRDAPRDTAPLLLLRHARTAGGAGGRRSVKRRAASPALSGSGRRQAAALVPVLERLGVTGLMAADVPACAETLSPFAAEARLEVSRVPSLVRDAFDADAATSTAGIRQRAQDGGPLVVCGQQRVTSRLVSRLVEESGLQPPPDLSVPKGGWWLLHHQDGVVKAYERQEPAA